MLQTCLFHLPNIAFVDSRLPSRPAVAGGNGKMSRPLTATGGGGEAAFVLAVGSVGPDSVFSKLSEILLPLPT